MKNSFRRRRVALYRIDFPHIPGVEVELGNDGHDEETDQVHGVHAQIPVQRDFLAVAAQSAEESRLHRAALDAVGGVVLSAAGDVVESEENHVARER